MVRKSWTTVLWQTAAFAYLGLSALVIIGGCGGVLMYSLNHSRMQNNPELLFPYYRAQLENYGLRLSNGEVNSEKGRGFGIPQYMIDHGAKYCTQHGDCFCIRFSVFLDNPSPELWFSPNGFDPMPAEITSPRKDDIDNWKTHTPQWASCLRR